MVILGNFAGISVLTVVVVTISYLKYSLIDLVSIKAHALADTMKLIAQTNLKNVRLVLSIPGMPCMDEAKTISLKIDFKFSFEFSIIFWKKIVLVFMFEINSSPFFIGKYYILI